MDSEIDLLINVWQQERCLWDVSTPLYASIGTSRRGPRKEWPTQ